MNGTEMLKMTRRVYEDTAVLIDRLEMAKLWGYGFPVVPIYVFVLRQLLMYILYSLFIQFSSNREIVPELLDHFDSVGFALSILVTKWFIPLFSNTIPFSLLGLCVYQGNSRIVPNRRGLAGVF